MPDEVGAEDAPPDELEAEDAPVDEPEAEDAPLDEVGTGDADGGGGVPGCDAGTSAGPVQAPTFVRNLPVDTGWFAAPVVADLDHDGDSELVAACYAVYVYDHNGSRLGAMNEGGSRVYAPHVVADLERDGYEDIVFGSGRGVHAYDWRAGAPVIKSGWPKDTTGVGSPPEVRGLAAADLDGNGTLEIVATTTQATATSAGGVQFFVFEPDGSSFQPPGISWTAWPRYNNLTGEGNDADRNGMGHAGWGCYGLNVGIGNIDDDSDQEILVTNDVHQIQAFNPDGVAIDASPWFTQRSGTWDGWPMTWGQMLRLADPAAEENHYHLHTGSWPDRETAEYLQWTASPPSVADLDGDGLDEVIGVPNVEFHDPPVTQAYAVMVLQGAQGDGSASARRLPGWETLPRGETPVPGDGWAPPFGVPAPAIVNIDGDPLPEVIVSLNDGYVYVFGADATLRWRVDIRHGKSIMYASEPTVADLNQDGVPEILVATFGQPDTTDSGWLMILGADGSVLHDVPLPGAGHSGSGNGAPAAPTVDDLDGDGRLEVFVQTFDHGLDEFAIPGSARNCVPWGTARGGPLRTGAPSGR
jgi:hypothetical protein